MQISFLSVFNWNANTGINAQLVMSLLSIYSKNIIKCKISHQYFKPLSHKKKFNNTEGIRTTFRDFIPVTFFQELFHTAIL